MRKFIKMVGATLLLAAAGAVGATPITLTDTTYFTKYGTNSADDYIGHGWGDVNKLSSPKGWFLDPEFDYVEWQHQYFFDPAADEILSGTLTLWLKDDNDKGEMPWELAFGKAEDGNWDLGFVDTGRYGYDVDVSALADGMFSVWLKAVSGDFYIKKSVLEITYVAVPEPGTVALLGAGLLGFGVVRRRNRKV